MRHLDIIILQFFSFLPKLAVCILPLNVSMVFQEREKKNVRHEQQEGRICPKYCLSKIKNAYSTKGI